MIYFDDAVTGSHLPSGQQYGVYYTDGLYANEASVRTQLPNAKLFGITVLGTTGHNIFACDCETGDLTVEGAIRWVEEQVSLGVALICVYANMSTWHSGLYTALEHYGPRIKRWVAEYDRIASVPAGFDCKQYDGGPTSYVDNNICLPGFFTPYAPKPPKPTPDPDPYHYLWFDDAKVKLPNSTNSERNVVKNYDEQRKHPFINHRSLNALIANLQFLEDRLALIMAEDDPKGEKYHRAWRRAQLQERALGKKVV